MEVLGILCHSVEISVVLGYVAALLNDWCPKFRDRQAVLERCIPVTQTRGARCPKNGDQDIVLKYYYYFVSSTNNLTQDLVTFFRTKH